ncbi:phasin family protein [Hephaestia mangrovi]|uniref:phasin family protein n=1 Tax=Hephaestia mangrovi TaxID=2873268 RepID=UPI001CA79B4D|nr:phasin family protein [Hephaestia mangrovi]MBY8827583.1 phasin family protein [Hephaestia mangrovi]
MADKKTDAKNATHEITERMKAAGEKMRASGEKIAERGSEMSMKLLDQAEHNTREAFDAMRRAAKARDLSEVMHVQGDYLREQGSRSMAQAREIGEMIANFGREAIGRMTGHDEKK